MRHLTDRLTASRVVVAVCILGALTACTESTPTGPPTSPDAASLDRRGSRAQPSYPAEARFIRLAGIVRGFGGYYFDRDGNVHAFLTDLARERQLRGVLATVLDDRRKTPRPRGRRQLIVHRGQYDFVQLANWRNALFGSGRDMMHSIAVDEARNGIRIGVPTSATRDQIQRLAATLGVPATAVRIDIAVPDRDLQTLSDVVIPPVGGILITGFQTSRQCTLGYNTLGGNYFVTNSHCTAVRGPDPDPTRFFQPDAARGYYAGFESEDPAYFSSAQNANCPTTANVCRWSDAALIQYVASAVPGTQGQGRLARTVYGTDGFTEDGSKDIIGYFTVTDEADFPNMNQELNKVGPSTGWTLGPVIQTCVNVLSGGYWYLCQDIVEAYAAEGDSGAPVFELAGGYNVTFHGVLRGWSTQYNGFSYSSFGNISADFGYLPAMQ